MIAIAGADGDPFVAWVQRLVVGVVAILEPRALHLVKLDHWFDDKWLAFRGKMQGAVGSWSLDDLRIPPFHPNRVRAESEFRRLECGGYSLTPFAALHREQPSGHNLQRLLRDVAPETACFWYSGDATAVGRGALMAYLPGQAGPTGWYVGLQRRNSSWVPSVLVGITVGELRLLQEGKSGLTMD